MYSNFTKEMFSAFFLIFASAATISVGDAAPATRPGDSEATRLEVDMKATEGVQSQVLAILGKDCLAEAEMYASLLQGSGGTMYIHVQCRYPGLWAIDDDGKWVSGYILRLDSDKEVHLREGIVTEDRGKVAYRGSGTVQIQTPDAALMVDYIVVLSPRLTLPASETLKKVEADGFVVWTNVRRVDRTLDMLPPPVREHARGR